MKRFAAHRIALAVGVALAAGSTTGYTAEPNWSYRGATGPAKWGSMNKGVFGECASGQFQSPIDIPDAKTRKGDFPSMLFNYKPSPLKITDTGRTIQIDYQPGSAFSVDGVRFELVEFHFHKPAETKIDGKSYEMEVQFVHKAPDGKQAIVAVLLEKGKSNKLMKTLMDEIPKGKETLVNALDLFPNSKAYYRYTGSMSKPPCSADVTWFVMQKPVPISAESIARFAKLYPMNARPTQPVNDRDIAASR